MGFIKLFINNRYISRGLNFTRVVRSYASQAAADDKSETEDGGDGPDGNKMGLVLGVYETGTSFELTPAAEEFNQKSEGKICKYLNELSCELKLGKAFCVTGLGENLTVALASLGPKDAGYNKLEELDEARENVRWAAGAGVRVLQARGCGHVAVDPCAAPQAAAEGATLAAWRFQEFKSCKKPETHVSLHGSVGAEDWERGVVYGRGQNWARLLADTPANNMTPADLAQAALDVLCPLGVRVEARDRSWIEAQDMQALLAAARGSCETPMFIECEYRAGQQPANTLLAGKGLTFDSGGLCLKSADNMRHNRCSITGGAVVLGALRILAELKIEDTDMEGRLMLADALVYGQTLFKPDLVIDVATMTNGVPLATAAGAYGCFSNSEAAWCKLRAAGARTGDRPWRYPLWDYYHRRVVDDPSVDLRNRGSGPATSCLGAAFLSRFVCTPWVHLDVTGVGRMQRAAPPYLVPARATGRPARALAAALEPDILKDSGEETHK